MSPDPTGRRPDRNLALELVRVTEYAALAAARLTGMGDKEAADQAAVDAMRMMLESVRMDGVLSGRGSRANPQSVPGGLRLTSVSCWRMTEPVSISNAPCSIPYQPISSSIAPLGSPGRSMMPV